MGPARKKCDEDKLRAAIESVRSKAFSLGKAAKIYGIPKTTLWGKVSEKPPIEKNLQTILTPEEEQELVQGLIILTKNGCKQPKQQLLEQVQKILKSKGKESVFDNNLLDDKWYYSFLERQGIVPSQQNHRLESRLELSLVQSESWTASKTLGMPESLEDKIRAAVQCVRSKTFTLGKAAKIFGIPKTTLWGKVHKKHPIEKRVKTILTPAEERKLACWLVSITRRGYKYPKKQVLLQVQKILNAEGRETVFTNNLPGDKWFYAFLKRQGILPVRKIDTLGNEPDSLEEEVCPTVQTAYSDQQNNLNGLLDIIQLIPPDKLTDYRHKLSDGKQCDEPEFVRFSSLYKRLSGISATQVENSVAIKEEKRTRIC